MNDDDGYDDDDDDQKFVDVVDLYCCVDDCDCYYDSKRKGPESKIFCLNLKHFVQPEGLTDADD